jgi:DNA-binding HxlR family transcriptional regulator
MHSSSAYHSETECAGIREVLSRVGGKWSLQVVGALAEKPRRHSELRRSLEGISQRILTLTLRQLERDGLVRRTIFPTVPPTVEYDLTPLGMTLIGPIRVLVQWVRGSLCHIEAAQLEFDGRYGVRLNEESPIKSCLEQWPSCR